MLDCCCLHFTASLKNQSQREKAELLLGRSIHLITSFKDFHHVFVDYSNCLPVDSYRQVCGLELLLLFFVIIEAAAVGLLLAVVIVGTVIVIQKQNWQCEVKSDFDLYTDVERKDGTLVLLGSDVA